MGDDTQAKLRALAERHGLQTSYIDIGGTTQAAAYERLRQALDALGVDAPDDALDERIADCDRARWDAAAPPVTVAWEGAGQLDLRLPASVSGRFTATITAEDGETFTGRGRIEDLPVVEAANIDGVDHVARCMPLPGPLPHGYHTLRVEVPGIQTAPTLVVSAPRRVYAPSHDDHRWGLFIPLYALHSARSPGAGDFADLADMIDWVRERGGSMVGTLPLLANFLDEPCLPSPYAPVSRLAWNELYLDVQSLPNWSSCREAQRAWNDADAAAARERLRGVEFVDHKAVMALKRRALEPMARQAWGSSMSRKKLEAFLELRPELEAYARFRALGATHDGAAWPTWPLEVREGKAPDGSYDGAVFRYHAYVQWCAHRQLDALARKARDGGDGLYLDLPVGVHGDGFDVWAYRDAFIRGLSTGAPPDLLFAGGQNWAFPPLHPQRQRTDHYRYLRLVLQSHLRYAGVLRIDHVMGLHRLFTIPQGAPATDGMYLRYPHEELYAILSLESHRSHTLLIGENLGTVPDEVTASMAEHGVHGMHVVQYQARPDPQAALPPAEPGDVASLNTHDMPPFASYWAGGDIDTQRELEWIDDDAVERLHDERARQRRALTAFLSREGPIADDADAPEAMRALLRHLGRSNAALVLVNLEDLLGETHSQNVPGTFREHPNWAHRAALPFETWRSLPDVTDALAELGKARTMAEMRADVRYDASKIGEMDLHLFGEGTHARIEESLGAHPATVDGVEGTHFAVWAPSADYVSVIGDFNGWDRGRTKLKARGASGVWEGFVAGVVAGDLYKLHVAGPAYHSDRADPVAARSEAPPRTASVVAELDYTWGDEEWMAARSQADGHRGPMSIYEVHLGSWRRVPEEGNRSLSYVELADQLVQYVREQGFTHVELLPVMEHPFYGSWGYQSTGYFAPTARYGSPQELMALVDALHRAGIGVILDWVPSHFPSDEHALARFDGTHLYEHADPRQGHHPDWDSSIFNYGRHEVQSFLVSSARHWLERYHADGLRVDAVASMLYLDYSRKDGEWIPNKHGGRENLDAIEFLRRLNKVCYETCPGIQTFAEESTAWPMVSRPTYVGGLGFGFKWDMGWMHDTLKYFSRDPIHRRYHHHELTFRMIYAFGENFVLPLSHDEVVHGKGSILGKMPGDRWQKFANLRALYGYMYGQPGKKLLFMGSEFGQEREWDHDRSLDWHLLDDHLNAGVQRWVADLNRLHRELPALHELDTDPAGFEWVDFSNADASIYAFLRKAADGSVVLVVCNFTPVRRDGYRIGVPYGGGWREVANSDAHEYGGSGAGNGGWVESDPIGAHERPHSLPLTLPPMSVLMLAPGGAP